MFDDSNDFNYFENRESEECMYEYQLNDIELNKTFDNMNNYKNWGLTK